VSQEAEQLIKKEEQLIRNKDSKQKAKQLQSGSRVADQEEDRLMRKWNS
jgi:hypothetical protein